MAFRPMGKRCEKAYQRLMAEIKNCKPGSRLPTEQEMCRRFGVSRTTLRQALAKLREEGIIAARRGAGTYVLPKSRNSGDGNANVISLMCSKVGPRLLQLQSHALQHGYLLHFYLQSEHEWDVEAERLFLEHVIKARHKALLALCTPHQPRHDELLREIAQAGVRVIHVAPYRQEMPDEEYIMPDYRRAGYMAAVALMLAGYDDFFFCRLSSDGPHVYLQEEGFAEGLQDYGRAYDPEKQRFDLNLTWGGDPSSLEPLRRFLASGKTAGIYLRSAEMVEQIMPFLEQWKIEMPLQAGLIGAHIMEEKAVPPGVDGLVFDSEQIVPRALEAVICGAPGPIRELVKPVWLQQGAVRGATPSQASEVLRIR
ncbi:MAG: GntR family transcriptional regulator, partial [Planctomycetota bacterium]|nr:GntR family transcriptional regulator [Planctomycetota bacterium]